MSTYGVENTRHNLTHTHGGSDPRATVRSTVETSVSVDPFKRAQRADDAGTVDTLLSDIAREYAQHGGNIIGRNDNGSVIFA